VLKPPVWTHDIAAYLFTGGLAAGSSIVAAGADLTGSPTVRRAGRATSMGALLASSYFLVKDLGRPERALNMLRVARPTSPMSMGSWILTAFGGAAGIAAASEAARPLVARGRWGSWRLAVGAGRPAGTRGCGRGARARDVHRGAPRRHRGAVVARGLSGAAFVFAGSALASGAGMGLIVAPYAESGPVRRLAIGATALEISARALSTTGWNSSASPTARAGRAACSGERSAQRGRHRGALLGRRSR
jgi:hypothetical protein